MQTRTRLRNVCSIEKIYLRSDNHIVIEAHVEEMGRQTHPQTLQDPPEYAAALCEAIISPDHLPEDVVLKDDEQFLEELIDSCNLASDLSWTPLDSSDDYSDEDSRIISRLYF